VKFLITGGAGFIGSNLAKRLLKDGHNVTIFDIIPKNEAVRLKPIFPKIHYKKIDILDFKKLDENMKGFDVIAHFAASADIALGKIHTDIDLKHGLVATYNILESMRRKNIKKIIFPSSSAIYGIPEIIPTKENTGMLLPTSLYGAAKLGAEGFISAFSHLFGIRSLIFRYGNVIGNDMTRGVIKDFIKKLDENPKKLKVLGDGNQKKDFIYIDDCLDGMLYALKNSKELINVFNLSSGTTTSVKKIARMVIKKSNLKNVKLEYTGGKSGWSGDVPVVHYNISKLKKLGWKPKLKSDQAVEKAIEGMLLVD